MDIAQVVVYVESNFVLELALLQEQHKQCQRIFSFAEQHQIKLVIPSYSLIEPYETTTRFFKKRHALSEEVGTALRQLGRSAPYTSSARTTLDELDALLVGSQATEESTLQDVLTQILNVAYLIPLNSEIIAKSFVYHQKFAPQDAVVYASILHHLAQFEAEERVFLTRNSKDFDDPDVRDELDNSGCKLLFTFEDGANYIQHLLNNHR